MVGEGEKAKAERGRGMQKAGEEQSMTVTNHVSPPGINNSNK